MTPELEEQVREIVRDEIRKAEATQRPSWSFERMDAAMRRVDDERKPTVPSQTGETAGSDADDT